VFSTTHRPSKTAANRIVLEKVKTASGSHERASVEPERKFLQWQVEGKN